MTASRRPSQIAAAVWAAAIVVAGVLPTQQAVHTASGGHDVEFTTVGHFVAYVVLGFLLRRALARPRAEGRPGRAEGRPIVLTLVLAAALGGAIELVQGPLPYRDAQLVDLVVNVAGAAAGLALFSAVTRVQRSRSRRG